MARDPAFDATWRDWIRTVRRQIGMVDLADLIYVHSEYYHQRSESRQGERAGASSAPSERCEIGAEDGPARSDDQGARPLRRAGRADRAGQSPQGPAAICSRRSHRQLGYPEVPRPQLADPEQALLPQLARRLEQLEARLKLVEEEQRGGLDLTKFYARPDRRPAGEAAAE